MRVTVSLLLVALGLVAASPALADSWNSCSSKNSDLAIKGCTVIIKAGRETKTNLAIAYYNRGITYAKMGQHVQAILDLDQAILRRPKYADYYYNRGHVYNDKGEFDLAIADYGKAILLNPKYAYAYGNRGVAYIDKGEYDRAIMDLDKAIKLDPKNGYSYYARGNAYLAKGQYEKALVDFRKAVARIPTSEKWNGMARERITALELMMASPN